MAKSKVYFAANGATNWAESKVAKAQELFYLAGFDKKIAVGDDVQSRFTLVSGTVVHA